MGFISLGNTDQLILEIPTERTENWAQRVKDNFVLKIVEHDHSGNGMGAPLGGAALADGSVNGIKFLLQNNQSLRSEGSTPSNIIDLFRLTVAEKLEIQATVVSATVENISLDRIIGKELVVPVTTTATLTITGGAGGRLEYSATSASGTQVGTLSFVNSGPVSKEYVGDILDIDIVVNGTDLEITPNDNDTTFKILKKVL